MKTLNVADVERDFYLHNFAQETDRAAAVLGGAFVDARLELVLRKRLSANQDELLGHMGPLGTFSARIDLAWGLRWVDSDSAHDLHVIRKIRNDFAHHLDSELSFESQSIADRCRNLRSADAHLRGYEKAKERNPNVSTAIIDGWISKFSSPRWRFHIAVESLDQILIAVSEHEPSKYNGPSLVDECYQSTAQLIYRVKATATVGTPYQN